MRKQHSFIFFYFLFLVLDSSTVFSQVPERDTIAPFTINTTGGTAGIGNMNIEWSVGELSAIEPMSNNGLLLTHGILQPLPTSRFPQTMWSRDEIRIYPIPSKSWVTIQFFSIETGRIHLTIFDAAGKLVFTKSFDYSGNGHIERINTEPYAAGTYIVKIELGIYQNTNSIQKEGVYKFQIIH